MAPPRPGRLRRQWPLLAVGALVAAGLVVTALPLGGLSFRWGGCLLALAVALAGVLRAVLPARNVGLLTARSRRFDVALLLVVAVGILVLSLSIPAAPPAR